MSKRNLFMIISIFLIFCIIGGIAYALYLKSIPSHVMIIPPEVPPPPEVALEFYSDQGCSVVCTSVEWGQLEQGTTAVRQGLFWVKNTGEVNVVISGSNTLPTEAGTLNIQFKEEGIWYAERQLNIGQVTEVKGEFTILLDAPLGSTDFSITVEAN